MTSMSSMTSMTEMASVTSSAASSTATAMGGMDMDMGMDTCKISMLWNWYTIDACFISRTWQIRSNGMFAASCIGVAFLVVSLELLRRLGKEYDAFILRKFKQRVAVGAPELKRLNSSDSNTPSLQFVTFRASPLQQLTRSVIHAVTFGVAYIVMLLAMYYNGYFIISIFIGAGLGKFLFDWMIEKVPLGGLSEEPKVDTCKDITGCCG